MSTMTKIAAAAALAGAFVTTPVLAMKSMGFDEAMAQAGKDMATHCKCNRDGTGKSKGWFFVTADAAFPTSVEGKPFLELSVQDGLLAHFVGPLTKPVTATQAKTMVGRKFCIQYEG